MDHPEAPSSCSILPSLYPSPKSNGHLVWNIRNSTDKAFGLELGQLAGTLLKDAYVIALIEYTCSTVSSAGSAACTVTL